MKAPGRDAERTAFTLHAAAVLAYLERRAPAEVEPVALSGGRRFVPGPRSVSSLRTAGVNASGCSRPQQESWQQDAETARMSGQRCAARAKRDLPETLPLDPSAWVGVTFEWLRHSVDLGWGYARAPVSDCDLDATCGSRGEQHDLGSGWRVADRVVQQLGYRAGALREVGHARQLRRERHSKAHAPGRGVGCLVVRQLPQGRGEVSWSPHQFGVLLQVDQCRDHPQEMGQVFSGSVDGVHSAVGRLGKATLGVQEKFGVSEDLGDRGAELVVDRLHEALAELTVTFRRGVLCGDVLDYHDGAADVTIVAS